MKSLNKLQITIILFSVLLFVLLYFANKTPETKAEELATKGKPKSSAGMNVFVDTKISTLPDSLKKVYTLLNATLQKDSKNLVALDSLVSFWDRIMQPDVAAFYTREKSRCS